MLSLKKVIVGFGVIASSLGVESAFAKVSLNSQCYMNVAASTKSLVGTNVDREFELASVSKMVTTFWAINKLGPHFRFQTKIHVTPLAGDTVDLHIEGSRDPYFGQHMIYFLASELNKLGIKKVETLSFDENFKINWYVRERYAQAARSYDPSPNSVAKSLDSVLIRNVFHVPTYNAIRAEAEKAFNLSMIPSARISPRRIEYIPREQFERDRSQKAQTYVLKSAPLHRHLKEMNIYSNNYVADMIYSNLGGNEEFSKFIKNKMGFDSKDLFFINGSGDSEFTPSGKLYNKGSCSALVKVLLAMRKDLEKQGLKLQDVMAVSGTDATATMGGRYADIPNTVIAKTGSVNPAITLSGMIATEKGDLVFAVLMKTGGPADWNMARTMIRTEVGKIIEKNGGASQISYTAQPYLPFDSQSILQPSLMSQKD